MIKNQGKSVLILLYLKEKNDTLDIVGYERGSYELRRN